MTDSSHDCEADEIKILVSLPSDGHDPVLLNETLDLLDPAPGKIIVDCTLGRGGHAAAIAARLGCDGTLIAIDADPRNLEFARRRLASAPCQVRFFHANFAELQQVLQVAGIPAVDGVLADLGISTNQLFESEYGMSFGKEMPLDMRIDPRTAQSAADIVNKMKEEDLANVLYELAQERYSRRIARKITEARRHSPIMTTDRLADLVRSAIPSRGGAPERIDPATRTFLALRMRVNREMENLAGLLKQAPTCLTRGGRLAVISFQSTEDRVVKQAFRSAEQAGLLRILTKKPLPPTDSEIARNPRSRSAKLRAAEKCIDGSSGV
ncbi:MAG TPA: 16S rRNA (cytosine(1402)-N(4))-methyltransferase RsmH [Humisphaera sp.]|nr:16S rRNA (cytosine(1402)-N(4))-methyltransferase RsmH [Humisphaera sp.]